MDISREEEVNFLMESYNFYRKNELKSEIFNNKKDFINKRFFVSHNYEF